MNPILMGAAIAFATIWLIFGCFASLLILSEAGRKINRLPEEYLPDSHQRMRRRHYINEARDHLRLAWGWPFLGLRVVVRGLMEVIRG